MSDLSFLSLADVRASERFRPVARSSMERRLREAGARFEERDGWLVAVHVPREERYPLAIRDVTHAYTVREGADGVEVVFRDGAEGARPPGGGESRRVTYPHASGHGRLVDVTAGYAALALEGPRATTLVRRLTDLDLEALPAVGAVAHVRTWVFRDGEEAYRLLFPQEFGHYVWEVVTDAAKPLGGGPKGTP